MLIVVYVLIGLEAAMLGYWLYFSLWCVRYYRHRDKMRGEERIDE